MNRYLVFLALAPICFLGGCKDSTGPATIPSTNEMSQRISTQKDFESSPFCKTYHCAFDKSWPLKTGETSLSYNISRNDISVEVSTRNAQVTGLGLVFVDQQELEEEDYDLIALLLKSTDAKRDHASTLSFIRKKIPVSVCDTCNVQEDGAHIQDGRFRVAAGKSGTPVLSLVRIELAGAAVAEPSISVIGYSVIASKQTTLGVPWAYAIVKHPPSNQELIALAHDLHKKYPNTRFQILDDSSRLQDLDRDFDSPEVEHVPHSWSRAHDFAMLNVFLADGNFKWRLVGDDANTSMSSKIITELE